MFPEECVAENGSRWRQCYHSERAAWACTLSSSLMWLEPSATFGWLKSDARKKQLVLDRLLLRQAYLQTGQAEERDLRFTTKAGGTLEGAQSPGRLRKLGLKLSLIATWKGWRARCAGKTSRQTSRGLWAPFRFERRWQASCRSVSHVSKTMELIFAACRKFRWHWPI